MNQFLDDVLSGLAAPEKYLNSKYLYDAHGDVLFQQIMALPEYYPTRCEMDIFTQQSPALMRALANGHGGVEVIELGAGDASKSVYLLKEMMNAGCLHSYVPVDISQHVINDLQQTLPQQVPGIQVQGLCGDYFSMLKKAIGLSQRPKIVLFLGGNIGNYTKPEAALFCQQLRSCMLPGNTVLIGFDLKKNPTTILRAYNDEQGITAQFNLNLLHRINRELGGNFLVDCFYHYPTYDPQTGACKSFLVSGQPQTVTIADRRISFAEGESIYMEISQKYALDEIHALSADNGFEQVTQITDSRGWFADAIWKAR